MVFSRVLFRSIIHHIKPCAAAPGRALNKDSIYIEIPPDSYFSLVYLKTKYKQKIIKSKANLKLCLRYFS